uniref:Protein argonaute 5 n=1 Tax=Tanacetum cinerariifolium TaxID=118510 RepID=A0A6L2ML07_TANCI|nr:protein argonaute 5 [Tanacetum cinerariifolium]
MRNLSVGTSMLVASVLAAVSLPLVASSSKLIKPPARPGFSTVGRKVMITANHFLVQLSDKNTHQYDGAQLVASSSCVPVQQQTPMQYRLAQSMLHSHGVGHERGAQPVVVVPTDAMRNLSIGTSTPVASVPVQTQPLMQPTPKTTTTHTEAVSLPLGAQLVASSSCVPVQQQTPMQYRLAQSMLHSHGVGHERGAQPVVVVPTDAMRNLSIGTSTPVASVPVQTQPLMQPTPKTTTTHTEAVSLPLVPSSSKLIKPPARPGFGTVGRKVMITADHFLV